MLRTQLLHEAIHLLQSNAVKFCMRSTTTLLAMVETPPVLEMYQKANIVWQIPVVSCILAASCSSRNKIIGQHCCRRLNKRLPLGGCEWNICRLQRGIATHSHQRTTRCNKWKGSIVLLKRKSHRFRQEFAVYSFLHTKSVPNKTLHKRGCYKNLCKPSMFIKMTFTRH